MPPELNLLTLPEQEEYQRLMTEFGEAAAIQYYDTKMLDRQIQNESRQLLEQQAKEQRAELEGTDPVAPPPPTMELTDLQKEMFKKSVANLQQRTQRAEPTFPGINLYFTEEEMVDQVYKDIEEEEKKIESAKNYEALMGFKPPGALELQEARKNRDAAELRSYEKYKNEQIITPTLRKGVPESESVMVRNERRPTLNDLELRRSKTRQSIAQQQEFEGFPTQAQVKEQALAQLIKDFPNTDTAALEQQADAVARQADTAEKRARLRMDSYTGPGRARQAGDPFNMPPTPLTFRTPGQDFVGGRLQRDPESIRDMGVGEAMFEALKPQTLVSREEMQQKDAQDRSRIANYNFALYSDDYYALPKEQRDTYPIAKKLFLSQLESEKQQIRDDVLSTNINAIRHPNFQNYIDTKAVENVRTEIRDVLSMEPRHYYDRDKLLSEPEFSLPSEDLIAQVKEFAMTSVLPVVQDATTEEKFGELTESMGMTIIRDIGLPFRMINNPLEEGLEAVIGEPKNSTKGQLYDAASIDLTEEAEGYFPIDAYLKEVALETATGYTMGNAFAKYGQAPSTDPSRPDIGLDQQDQNFLIGTAAEIFIPYGTLLKVPGYIAKSGYGVAGKAIGAAADISSLKGAVKGTAAADVLRPPRMLESTFSTNTYLAEKAADNIVAVEAAKDIARARVRRAKGFERGDQVRAEATQVAETAVPKANRSALIKAQQRTAKQIDRSLPYLSEPDKAVLIDNLGNKVSYTQQEYTKVFPKFSKRLQDDITDIHKVNLEEVRKADLTPQEVGQSVYDDFLSARFADEPLEIRAKASTPDDEIRALDQMNGRQYQMTQDLLDKADGLSPDGLARFADDMDGVIQKMATKDDVYGDMARIVLREGGLRYGRADNTIAPLSALPGVAADAKAPIKASGVIRPAESAASYEQLVEAGAERLARFNLDKYTALTDRISVSTKWMKKNQKDLLDRHQTIKRVYGGVDGKYEDYFKGVSNKTLRRDVKLQTIIEKTDNNLALTAAEEMYLDARILEMEALQVGANNRADLFFNSGVIGEKIAKAPELRLKDFQPGVVAGSIATLAGDLGSGAMIGLVATRNGRQTIAELGRLGLNAFGIRRSPAQLINKAKEVVGQTYVGRAFNITEAPVYAVTFEQQQMRQAVIAAKGEVERIEQVITPTVRGYIKWASENPGVGNIQERGLFQMMVQSQKSDPSGITLGILPDTELAIGAAQLQDLGRITFGALEAQDAAALADLAISLKFVDEVGEVAIKSVDDYKTVMATFLAQNRRYADTTATVAMGRNVSVPEDLVKAGLPASINTGIDFEGTFIVAAANGMARRRIERVISEKVARSSIRVESKKEADLILRTAINRIQDPITYNPYLATREEFSALMKSSGYTNDEVAKTVRYIYGEKDQLQLPGIGRATGRAGVEDRLRAFYGRRDSDLYNQVRAAGLGNAEDPVVFAQQIGLTQETLFNEQFIGIVGANTRAELNELKTMLGDPKSLGQLARGFEQLSRPENQNALNSVMNILGLTLGDIRRSFVSGQLGGKYLPNFRYQMENIASAPAIAAITLDNANASKFSLNRLANPTGARYFRKMVQTAPDEIIPGSLNITYRQAYESLNRVSIGSSNSALQLSDVLLADIKAIARADAAKLGGQNAKSIMYAADDLIASQAGFRAKKSSPHMKFAMDTDFYFREAMYFDQLKQGKTVEQAADIAKNAFLDYGALPPIAKQAGARGLLYLSFMYRTSAETVKALFKPNAITRLGKLSQMQRSAARYYGAYEYVGDRTLQSFFLTKSDPDSDYVDTYFRNPWTSNMMMYSQAIGFGMNVYENDPETTVTTSVDAAMDFFYLPVLDVIRDLDPDYKKGVPPKTVYQILQAQHMAGNIDAPFMTDVGQALSGQAGLPGENIALRSMGLGRPDTESPAEYYVDRYDLEVRPIGSQVPGSAKFSDFQYRFASKSGYNNFRLDALLMATLGAQRMGQDATAALIAGGVVPPGSEFGYLENGTPALYLFGRQSPVRVPKEWEVRDRQIRQAASKLKEMEKSYGYKAE